MGGSKTKQTKACFNGEILEMASIWDYERLTKPIRVAILPRWTHFGR